MRRLLATFVAGVVVVLGGVGIAVATVASFDDAPWREEVMEQFNDGEIMDAGQARCVSNDVAHEVDWQRLARGGLVPDGLFEGPLTDRLLPGEIDSLVGAIDRCRGAGEVVLRIFESQGEMDDLQLGCFASQMSATSSRDLLRLIIAGDQAAFTGSEGEVLLGVCGRGASS